MDRDPIGQFIRERRQAKGMSLEELSHDICNVSNLSKIELEGRIPRSSVLHQLLERLGEPDTYYTMPLDKYENQIRPLRKKARALVVAFGKATGEERSALREEALSALEKMEKVVEKDDLLTRQRILGDRVTLGTPAGPYPPARERELLLEALRLTVSGFDVSRIDNFRYTQEETGLINKIAITYVLEGDRKTAITIYKQLLSYIQENNQQLSRYANQLTLVAYNYARELDVDGQYDEAVRVAELGRKTAVQYGYHQALPGLLHIIAECQHYLGNDTESKELYLQAHYIYKAFEEWNDLEILKKDALEQLGLTFS